MKIAQLEGYKIHWITPYTTLNDVPDFAPDIVFAEVDDNVQEGYVYNPNTEQYEEYTPPEQIDFGKLLGVFMGVLE